MEKTGSRDPISLASRKFGDATAVIGIIDIPDEGEGHRKSLPAHPGENGYHALDLLLGHNATESDEGQGIAITVGGGGRQRHGRMEHSGTLDLEVFLELTGGPPGIGEDEIAPLPQGWFFHLDPVTKCQIEFPHQGRTMMQRLGRTLLEPAAHLLAEAEVSHQLDRRPPKVERIVGAETQVEIRGETMTESLEVADLQM